MAKDKEKSLGATLEEQLTFKKKNFFEESDDKKIKKAFDYAVGYMKYLDESKTEREAVKTVIIVGGVNDLFGGKAQMERILHFSGTDRINAASGIFKFVQQCHVKVCLEGILQFKAGMIYETAQIVVAFKNHFSIIDKKRSAEMLR